MSAIGDFGKRKPLTARQQERLESLLWKLVGPCFEMLATSDDWVTAGQLRLSGFQLEMLRQQAIRDFPSDITEE